MSTEVMNMSEFKKNLTARVKEEFINLIPQDRLEAMTEQIIEDFKKKDLERIVKQELRNHLIKRTQAYVELKRTTVWNNVSCENELDNEMKKLLIKIAPDILANIFNHSVQNILSQMNPQGYRY